jgi:2-polyprenyl-3-methyl-5-hydroxy-6-metoxy-1,4-benzoquinol methylase
MSAETSHRTSDAERDDPERFDPEAGQGLLIEAEHRARYWAAAALANGRRVLDAGCGTGYGSEMLRDAGAASIAGFDLAEEAVRRTSARLGDGADVRLADIHALPFDDASFDLVVCFEVLEHVTEQEAAIAELRRVLAPDGVLVISSPNPLVYPAGNPHHVHELEPSALRELVAARFANVETWAQHVWLASAVHQEGGGLDVAPRYVGPAPAADSETYALAVASDGPLPALAPQVALAATNDLQWFRDRIAYLEAHLAEVEAGRDEDVRRLMADSHRAGTRALEAERRLGELEATLLDLESRNATLADFEWRYHEARTERQEYERGVQDVLARKDAEIAALYASPSWRVTAPLRALKRRLRRR